MMCLLQSWYGLNDYEVEDQINDSLSLSSFCGMTTKQVAPDYSTLSRFRTALTKTKTFKTIYLHKQAARNPQYHCKNRFTYRC